ncbi:hypothetical protein N9166_01240, partial [bacterium]|nr:hypothetical protein [bacterium]
VSNEDFTAAVANGGKPESRSRASQWGGLVLVPRAGERALLGLAQSALHERLLHENVGGTAGEPDRMRAPEALTLGSRPSP